MTAPARDLVLLGASLLCAAVVTVALAAHYVAPATTRDLTLRATNHREDVQAGVGRLDSDGLFPLAETGDTE